ncbi:hypothetical protein ACIF6L_26500 [Kitasatospora sp. NPDC086009]|uniref:hypothetical protein n=1 Tax=unclassified Kitasatospora TaxID=2633591 RepID=UPI0037C63059
MATIKPPDHVTVEVTTAELALVRRALRLVRDFGDVDDWDGASALLTDLEAS